ncbi:hypothetical protein L7F22_024152 [Adiantum nelumboides]|nr:hypothetical protein [Adiantum nelumboides]
MHGKIFAADEYSRDLHDSFAKIKEGISIAQQKHKAAADKHRRPVHFSTNDWVLLKFSKARLRHTMGKSRHGELTGHQKYYAKLTPRYYGPFQILRPINETAYQLKLPSHWPIHNAFHVNLLKAYKGDPPQEPVLDDPPEFEGLEEIATRAYHPKQYSEKELEAEIDARLARILGAQKQGKKHDKKRKKSTDFNGYLGSQSTFDKAKKHKKHAAVPSSSSSSERSSESSEEERRSKKRSRRHQHGKGKRKTRKSRSRRADDSSTEDSSTDSSDSEDGHFYANKKNFYQANQYDFLEDKSKKVREFKEGGQSIKFETFSGYKDASKALSFIQQFDIVFAGGRYSEHSKIRRAASYLKGNARTWWSTLLLNRTAPSGHDGIWTIIDRFSKQAYFVPVKKTVKPDHLARLFVAQIFRLHGMPETIVSDRDPRFTSLFWKAIWENIGMRLQFSSSFHLQTDGQSEIANSVVLDLLKSYISDQKTQWKRKVPPFLSTKDKILEANEYTRDLDTDFAKVRETLQKSQERQKKAVDLHRHDSKLKENDWVLLRFDKARLRQKKGKEELSMRYYGPFQITKQINDISFRLRLPDTWKIHNVFHVNLWKTFGDVPDDGEPDEQPEVEANEEILVPEQELKDEMTAAFWSE